MQDNPGFAQKVRNNWNNNGNEVGWFFINDPTHGVTVMPWPDDSRNSPDSVYGPPTAPPNAIGSGHTHPDPNGMGNGPSGDDYAHGYDMPDFVFDPQFCWKYWPEKKPYRTEDPYRHDIPNY